MEAVARKQRRFNFRGSLCMPYALFMLLFVVFPLLLIVYYAFTDGDGKFTFGNWGTVFTNMTNWKVIGSTLLIAAITTIICIYHYYNIYKMFCC